MLVTKSYVKLKLVHGPPKCQCEPPNCYIFSVDPQEFLFHPWGPCGPWLRTTALELEDIFCKHGNTISL